MYRLRVKTKGGGQFPLTDRVNGDSTLADLLAAIQDVTSVAPERQKILSGFPPKPIKGSYTMTLKTVGVRNGDVLIVEDVEPSTNATVEDIAPAPVKAEGTLPTTPRIDKVPTQTESSEITASSGILLKKVVPSDNSCLFASILYLVNGGGNINQESIKEMRQLVANMVKSQPELYHEAVLEKSNADYCNWILKDTSWGGAIELSVLSQYYEMEIVALDAKTGVLNRFGEDKKFSHRMIVMYDGIHYDPIYMETFEGNIITIFNGSDESILLQAKELAMEANRSGQFTDTNAFRLRCQQCGQILTGDEQALAHAGKTGHLKFDEVNKN
ncbi:ubiquitin thioesterase OTU1 isoform X1 [Macrobrachium rosenbergii]|uniref:ubiquitin thioesterase OTU1 isoform X1 n=1 Tax=Macrobrachium rosenbergii TaxID=79674 RepID=UPI0034D3DFF4